MGYYRSFYRSFPILLLIALFRVVGNLMRPRPHIPGRMGTDAKIALALALWVAFLLLPLAFVG
jgi:hypothetical protein